MIGAKAKGEFNPKKVREPTRKTILRTLYRLGGYGHKVAKRSLRRARKIRVSELPDEDQETYREQKEDYHNGYRDTPPVLRDIISDPGKPPLLHSDRSPLKLLTTFAVDENKMTVVWGPKKAEDGIAGDLEYGRGKIKKARPFIRPSLEKTLPKLPDYLRAK